MSFWVTEKCGASVSQMDGNTFHSAVGSFVNNKRQPRINMTDNIQPCVYNSSRILKTQPPSYVYWNMHYLYGWIKRDQLDVTCFIIPLFNAQHVSDVNTPILRSLRLICWVISWVVLLWFDACWCYVVVWLGWCGISGYYTNPGGGEIFLARPDQPWGPPIFLYNGYRDFPAGKSAGAWSSVDHTTTSRAQVKETVEVYLYSPSGPSWPGLGWPLALPLRVSVCVCHNHILSKNIQDKAK